MAKIWLYGNSFGVFEADGKPVTHEKFLDLGGFMLSETIHQTSPFSSYTSWSGWSQ